MAKYLYSPTRLIVFIMGVYIHLSIGTIRITWNVLVSALFVENGINSYFHYWLKKKKCSSQFPELLLLSKQQSQIQTFFIYYNTWQIKAANRPIWEAGTSTFDTDVRKMPETINGLLWSLNFRDSSLQLWSAITEFPVGLSEFSCEQNIASHNI